MAISDIDCKILWGRAAGMCSNPNCQQPDLTIVLESGGYIIGEMAHIIARKPTGPRGQSKQEDNSYKNLILLCPTCHTIIDKAPNGEYSKEILYRWKNEHEEKIKRRIEGKKFSNFLDLKREVNKKLIENKIVWEEFGPYSEVALSDPSSNLHDIWQLKKIDTIIPNNNFIINCIHKNEDILPSKAYKAFILFKNHATAFEKSQYSRLDHYPIFPKSFTEEFGNE